MSEVRREISHSLAFVRSFNPIRVFLKLFGRLPFYIKTNELGVSSFHFRRFSAGTIYFCVAATMSVIPFLMIVSGFLRLLARYNDDEKDWCANTWEDTMLARHLVPITHSLIWLLLTFVSSYYMFFQGQRHSHYFNYWNRAVQVLDMDVTKGLRRFGLICNIEMAAAGVVWTIVFATFTMPVVYDSAGMMTHMFVQFFDRDIYRPTLPTKPPNPDWCIGMNSYYWWTWFGFFLQLYSFYGARSFIVEYQFFCRALNNAAKIWNDRFLNLLHAMESRVPCEEDQNDQTKRRLDISVLLKDHLIIVKLFKMTEATFQWILVLFYFGQMINLFVSVYFISQIGTLKSCHQQFETFRNMPCVQKQRAANSTGGVDEGVAFLECGTELYNHVYEAIVAILLFITTFYHFWNVTMATSNAFEEAMRAHQIMKNYMYTVCRTRKERNFMHSLSVSFAKNNPVGINGGGYFQITREFVLVIYGAVTTCFIILIQTRPSAITFTCV